MVKVSTTHMNAPRRGQTTGWISRHGKTLVAKDSIRKAREDLPTIHPDQPRASSPINDNCCLKVLQTGLLARRKPPTSGKTNFHVPKTLVNSFVVNPVLTAPGPLQKKDTRPGVAECYQESKVKYVEDGFCVDQLSFVKPVTNVL